MKGAHVIEDLCFEVDFASEDEAFEAQERLMRFAQVRAQAVIAEVFDEAVEPDEVLRLDKLEVDVGTIAVGEFEERFAERLREVLRGVLRERRAEVGESAGLRPSLASELHAGQRAGAAPRPLLASELHSGQWVPAVPRPALDLVSSPGLEKSAGLRPYLGSEPSVGLGSPVAQGQAVGFVASVSAADAFTTAPRAEFEWLLHFIEYGFLPWHAPAHIGRDVQTLAARVLERNGVELARALRAFPGRQWRVIFRRMVEQFPAQWLARLGRQIGLARGRVSIEALGRRAGAAGDILDGVSGSVQGGDGDTAAAIDGATGGVPNAGGHVTDTAEIVADGVVSVADAIESVVQAGAPVTGAAERITSAMASVAAAAELPNSGAASVTGAAELLTGAGASVAGEIEPVALPGSFVTDESEPIANAAGLVANSLVSPVYPDASARAHLTQMEASPRTSGMSGVAVAAPVGFKATQPTPTVALDEFHEAFDGSPKDLARSQARSQIEAIFRESPESDFTTIDPVLMSVTPVASSIWRRVLRDDAPWLKEALLQFGRGVRARRRLAAVLPEEVVAEVLGLWLAPAQIDIVLATTSARPSSFTATSASQVVPRGAISPAWLLATLTYILVDGGGLKFSESDYRHTLASQTVRGVEDVALEPRGGAVKPASGPPPSSGAVNATDVETVSGITSPTDSNRVPSEASNIRSVDVSTAKSRDPAGPKPTQSTPTVAPDEFHEAFDDSLKDLARSQARSQIEAMLGESPESDVTTIDLVPVSPLAPVATDTWRRVLRNDTSWLKETLLRFGRGVRARRRLAAVLPEEFVAEVLGLWLAPAEIDVVLATTSARPLPFTESSASQVVPRGAVSRAWLLATLTYILVDRGDLEFSESGYQHSLANQTIPGGDEIDYRHETFSNRLPRSQSSTDAGQKPTKLTGLRSTDAVKAAGHVNATDGVGTADAVGTADTVGMADAVGTADAVGMADAVGTADTVSTAAAVSMASESVVVNVGDTARSQYDTAAQAFSTRDAPAVADNGVYRGVHGRSGTGAIDNVRSGTFAPAQPDTDPAAGTTPDSTTRATHRSRDISEVELTIGAAAHLPDHPEPFKVAAKPNARSVSEESEVTDTVDRGGRHEALAYSRAHALIEAVLSESPDIDFQVAASVPVSADTWRCVLRDDAAWLKATLLRLGRGVRVRRRLAAALPDEVVADVLALWLSPAQIDIVITTIGVSPVPFTDEMGHTGAPLPAFSDVGLLAALTYILVEGGAREFNEVEYRNSLANQAVRDSADTPLRETGPSAALGATVELSDAARGSLPSLIDPDTQQECAHASSQENRASSAASGQGTHAELPMFSGATATFDTRLEGSSTAHSGTHLASAATQSSEPGERAQVEIFSEGRPVILAATHFESDSKIIDVTAGSLSSAADPEIPWVTDTSSFVEPSQAGANLRGAAQSLERDATKLTVGRGVPGAKDSATGELSPQLPDIAGTPSGHPVLSPIAFQLPDETKHDSVPGHGMGAGGKTGLGTHTQSAPDPTHVQSNRTTANVAHSAAFASAPVGLTPTSADRTSAPIGLTPTSADLAAVPMGLAPTSSGAAPAPIGLTPTSSGPAPAPIGLTPTSSGPVSAPIGLAPTPPGPVPAPMSLASTPVSLAPTSRAPASSDLLPTNLTRLADSTDDATVAGATPATSGDDATPHEVDPPYRQRGESTLNSPSDALRRAMSEKVAYAEGPAPPPVDLRAMSAGLASTPVGLAPAVGLAPGSRTPTSSASSLETPATLANSTDNSSAIGTPPTASGGDAVIRGIDRPHRLRGDPTPNLPADSWRSTMTANVARPVAPRSTSEGPESTRVNFAPAPERLAPAPSDLTPIPEGPAFTPTRFAPAAKSLTPTSESPVPSSVGFAPASEDPAPASHRPASPAPQPASLTGLDDSTNGPTVADASAPASGAGQTPHDVDLLRYLRGIPTPATPADALRRALRVLLDQRPAAARDTLRSALELPGAGRRLAGLLGSADLDGLLLWLRPTDGIKALAVANRVSKLGQNPAAVAPVVREFLLTDLFEEGRTFDPESFAQRLSATLNGARASRAKPAPPPRLAAAMAEDVPINQRIYIANAGVVIVGPYLPRLFSMLGLTNKDSFTSLSSAQRAVHLIQYIVTGATVSPEPILVLNKILCGLPIVAPIPLDIDLRAQEQTAIEEMLTAIIAHWKAIGRTSIGGLRESFLQREGRIASSDEAWRLRVESKCFDMLLDRLPWGYAMVKYPWMKRVLHVDWR